jgi:hypothetical protein
MVRDQCRPGLRAFQTSKFRGTDYLALAEEEVVGFYTQCLRLWHASCSSCAASDPRRPRGLVGFLQRLLCELH